MPTIRCQYGHYLDETYIDDVCPVCEAFMADSPENYRQPIKHASGEDWRSILDEEEEETPADITKRRIIGDTDEFSLRDHLKKQFPYGHERFIELCIEEMALHSKKNYDYAHGGNPLGNFTRVANILSNYPGLKLTPAVIALIYMFKQLDSTLWQLSQGYEGEVEGMDKRLEDVHVYAKLARILLEKA